MTTALVTEGSAAPKTREEALDVLDRLRAGEAIPPAELNFQGVSLPGADLRGLQLSMANFTDADLSGADLSGATFFKATCVQISLMGANLEGAEFSGADLSRGNLEDAKASRVGLGMASLKDARLFSAHLEEATLTKADLSGADVRCSCLKGSRIREADLRNSDFTGADLRGADLSLSRLEGAVFNNADLRDSRLRAIANFQKAEWLGTDIRDINFAGAYRLRRHIVDENYLWEFKEASALNRAVYHVWSVTSDCGRSIARWCVWILVLILVFAWGYAASGVSFGSGSAVVGSLYYSVVTLTTLGYGDIVPVTSTARILAMIQVFMGYLMLGGLLSIFANKMARRAE